MPDPNDWKQNSYEKEIADRDRQLEKDYDKLREVIKNMTDEEREEIEFDQQQTEDQFNKETKPNTLIFLGQAIGDKAKSNICKYCGR